MAALPHSSRFLLGSKGSAATHRHTSGTTVSALSSEAAGHCSFERLFILKYLVCIPSFPLCKKQPSQRFNIRAERTEVSSPVLSEGI